jgi:ubiquitin carboxyl-terminal hydrolase L5
VRGLEVAEIYDIEPWATDHLNPRGLIFCYPCNDSDDRDKKEENIPEDDIFPDPDAKDIWYAHQLSNDACASQTILNIVLNLKGVEMENLLKQFHADTCKMDPIVSYRYDFIQASNRWH